MTAAPSTSEPAHERAREASGEPVLDHSGYVRRARRIADLSQRELSAAIGIDQSQVARIESGRSVDVATFARMLATAGLRLAIVDADGVEVAPMPVDVMRDRGGRRQPAHLDVRAAPDRPSPEMLARHREPEPRSSWHHRRDERDRRRHALGIDGTHEQPTVSSVDRWRRDHEAARRERARPVARRELTRLYAQHGFPEGFGPYAVHDDATTSQPISGRDGPPATAPP